ncbi:MAG: T9SS type A sorting domain-containing protein [Chitinophagales bacterium]
MKIRLLLSSTFICLISVAYSQLPNGGMEAWSVYTSVATGLTCDVPDAWDIPDKIGCDLDITDRVTTKETVNVHGGTAAARLETKLLNIFGTDYGIPGTITTGVIGVTFTPDLTPSVTGGCSVSAAYDALEGYFQYSPAGSDTMNITILMFSGTDTIGGGVYRNGANTPAYTLFECPIFYPLGGTPDKMQIIITSSGSFATPEVGSVLFIDDMEVTGGIGIEDWNGYGMKRNIYPNPATDYININNPATSDVTMEVYNLNGQKVDVQTLSPEMNSINLESYASGIYTFRLIDNGSIVYSNKFVVK